MYASKPALEALSENTRRAYGVALRSWGLWAAVHGIEALAPSPAAFRGLSPGTGPRREVAGVILPARLECFETGSEIQVLHTMVQLLGDWHDGKH